MRPISRTIFLSFLFLTLGFSVSTVQATDVPVAGTISNTTWVAGNTYLVTGDITVPAGATLIIQPGVVVRFNQYTGMYVDGTLQAMGTSGSPIIFTGTTQSTNWWKAISVGNTGSAAMAWCTIEYAGNYHSAGILKSGSGSLSLINSIVSHISGDGLRIGAGYSTFTSAGNSFQNNNYGVRLGISTSFDDNTSNFSGNNVDVFVDGGTITGAVTWNLKKDYSLFISNEIAVSEGSTLTIKPGTVAKFNQYCGMYIDGQLDAQGTSASPIYFTDWRDDAVGGDANGDNPETPPSPSWWKAIYVRNAGSAVMTWCTVRYGGYYNSVGLYKTGPGDLSVTDCTVSNTYGNGMAVVGSSGETVLTGSTFTENTGSGLYMNSGPTSATNCTFSNNTEYGIFQEVNDSLVYTGNTFAGNTAGGVGVNGGTMNNNFTWQAAGSPFRVVGDIFIAADKTLIIEPGVEVRFSQYTGVYVDGTLQAKGTSDGPIIFTGTTQSAGWWKAINIRSAGTAVMEWCTVRYGGYYDSAGVLKTGTGSLSLKNSTIQDISGDGLRIGAGYSAFSSAGNTFKDNTRYGVYLGINTSFDDNTSNFRGNNQDVHVDGGVITVAVTWNLKPDYSLFISGDITVSAEGTLTVKPGTTVKFGQYLGMWIDGRLDAQGTSASPIYFTDWRDDAVGGDANGDNPETPPSPSWWKAIYVRNAGSAVMTWCTVRYGGYYNSVGLYKTGSGDLSVTDCTVSNTYGNGMAVVNSSGETVLTGSTFTENTGSGLYMNSGPTSATNCTFSNNTEYGIFQEVNDSLVYTGNTFAGNTAGGVGVSSGTINGNIVWQAAGSPFRIAGDIVVSAGNTLAIEPGVKVEFNNYTGVYIDGTLQAKGTSDSPIIFTGTTQSAGWWKAINIRSAGTAVMEWCTVEYGGHYDWADILKTGTGSLSIKNSIIRQTNGDGLRIAAGYSAFTSAGNSFSNCNYGVRLGINTSFDDNTSDFSENNVDVYMDGGIISGDVVWNLNPDYSLFVSNDIIVSAEGILTVKPGTVVKFGQYLGLWIDGQLNAQGTSAGPIFFTDWRDDTAGGDANGDNSDTLPSPNWWKAVYVRNAGSADMQWSTIRYGGYYDWAGILKTGTGDLDITHCTISSINGDGLRITGSTGMHSVTRNTFTLNSPTVNYAGVHILNQPDQVTITGNLIEGNTNWGMLSQNSAQVDATGNWWGDETGPHQNSLNPDGQGDNISDGIVFDPWRATPSAGEILAPLRSGTLVQGDSLRFMGSLIEDAGAAYSWDFGDGRTSSDRSPGIVKFPDTGDHEVQFRAVINGEADAYPDTRTFTVAADTGAFPDLQVTGVTIPDSLAVGQPATIAYTARNSGDGPITGASWKDALYLSDDPYLDAGDERLGIVSVESDVAAGASYQNAINITLPVTADDAARYLILSLNDEWQFVERHRLNNEHAAAVTVMIPSLENDESQLGNYGSGRVEQYYRMTADPGQNLVLTFDHEASGLDVYVRYGALPTRSAYDFRLTGQELSIPGATAGQWYILVYGNTSSSGQYTIGYSMTDLALSGVSPNRHTTLADAELTLTGAGFISPLAVELVSSGGSAYPADSVEVDSFTQAVAVFSAGSPPAGTYTVRVSHGGKSDELASAVEIVAGGTAKLETKLILMNS